MMMKITPFVLAFSKSLLILMFVCLFTANGHAKKNCNDNEYYQSVLQNCRPCEDVCEPLNRSDCQRLCQEFYRRHTECQPHQYWKKYLEICVNCSDICVPITRLDCKDRCQHYIDSLKTTTTTTTTTEKPKHTENISPKQTVQGNRPGQSDILMTIIVCLLLVIGVVLIVAICWCHIAKIKALFRTILHTVKTEKVPIQETDDPVQSDSLLADAQRNLENGQQSTV